MTGKLYCYPCNMTFRVEAPARNKPEAEHTTCECGRHFWHSGASGGKPARVGVWPKDAEREATAMCERNREAGIFTVGSNEAEMAALKRAIAIRHWSEDAFMALGNRDK